MKTSTFLFLFGLFHIPFLLAQYTVQSEYILHPDRNIDQVQNSVQFWIDHAYDAKYGGFFSAVPRTGIITDSLKKSLISQTRQAYGFTRAFMMTGNESYLTYAKSAYIFLVNHGWDTTNDGWYCFAKRDGSLDNRTGWNPNTGKWGFQQQYAMLGIVALYEATHNPDVKTWMDKGLNTLYTKMWDSRPGYEGYYEQTDLNWSNKRNKGFTSTVDAITTNAELAYLVTQEPARKEKLLQLADVIVKRFIPTMNDTRIKVLYPESYSTDWSVSNYSADGSVGHFIKTAWVLGRAYLCDTTKVEYKNAATKILNQAWTYDNGKGVTVWDHVNGGPFNNLNIGNGGWGKDGNVKDYWTLEQGFTAPMLNYYITNNPIYLQMADESLSFYRAHFTDNQYGETYQTLSANGASVLTNTKGDDFKANYHNVELGYYAYLYSSLYYLHEPVSLYYKLAPSTDAQTIKLTPIPMEDNLLRIKSVSLDGVDFSNFDPVRRTINLAANEGGKLKVTFESIPKSPTELIFDVANTVKLYPTQVKGMLTIENIVQGSNIRIYDMTSKLVVAYNNQPSNLFIDLQNLRAGVYFVELESKNYHKITRKIVKL